MIGDKMQRQDDPKNSQGRNNTLTETAKNRSYGNVPIAEGTSSGYQNTVGYPVFNEDKRGDYRTQAQVLIPGQNGKGNQILNPNQVRETQNMKKSRIPIEQAVDAKSIMPKKFAAVWGSK